MEFKTVKVFLNNECNAIGIERAIDDFKGGDA